MSRASPGEREETHVRGGELHVRRPLARGGSFTFAGPTAGLDEDAEASARNQIGLGRVEGTWQR